MDYARQPRSVALRAWGQPRAVQQAIVGASPSGADVIGIFNEINEQLHALGVELATDLGSQAATLILTGATPAQVSTQLFAPTSTPEQRTWFATAWAPLVWDWNAFAETPIQARMVASMGAIIFIEKALNDWRERVFDADKAARELGFKLTLAPPTPPSKNIVQRVEEKVEEGAKDVWNALGNIKTAVLISFGIAGVALLAFIVKESTSR